jgi:hypothetical protein
MTGEQLDKWIHSDHLLQPAGRDGERLEGGHRLLIHKWSYNPDGDEKFLDARMPFESKRVLGNVLEKLGVCKSYPLDFVRRQPIPLRVTFKGKGNAQKMSRCTRPPTIRLDAEIEQELYAKVQISESLSPP